MEIDRFSMKNLTEINPPAEMKKKQNKNFFPSNEMSKKSNLFHQNDSQKSDKRSK